ncbi:MAG TPA: hypothetical protein VNK04_05765 [Gemmataceae bacterium]|nr:hypothetical protein [Gemmataceae bacterium]
MIEEHTAVEIATRFLKARGVDDDGFAEARYVPEEQVWACLFHRKTPPDAVDAPGVIIVHVNGLTGEPSFFDTL